VVADRASRGVERGGVSPPLSFIAPALALVLAALTTAAHAADVEAGRKRAESCAACHGPDGNATIPGTPSLAGQYPWFTHWALIKFRDGRRRDPQMSPPAQKLSDADMADVAAYYAAQPSRPKAQTLDPVKARDGRRLAETYQCLQCHRPDLAGQPPHVPRLAGQDLEYLIRILRAYRARTAADLDGSMTQVAQTLTDAEIEALAHYAASQGARPSLPR
jgi:cytochrome c553